MTLKVQKSAIDHIAEFCGETEEPGFVGAEKQIPLKLCYEVIKGLAIEQLRCSLRIEAGLPPNPHLLDIPLPEPLQQMIVAHIPFRSPEYDYPGRECTGEDLCRRTERAFLRHMDAVLHLQQQFNSQMWIVHRNLHIAGCKRSYLQTRAELPLNLAPDIFPWEVQYRLDIIEAGPELSEALGYYNDEDLTKVLTKFDKVQHLRLENCNRLRSLEGLSKLRDLRILELINLSGLYLPAYASGEYQWDGERIERPPFDFDNLDLPNLEELLLYNPHHLAQVIDVRKCKKLQKLTIKVEAGTVDKPIYTLKTVDVRGLDCQVIIDPLRIRFKGSNHSWEWTKVLGTNAQPVSHLPQARIRSWLPVQPLAERVEQNASNTSELDRLRDNLHISDEENESSPHVSSEEEGAPASSPRAGRQQQAALDAEEERYQEERYIEESQLEREALMNALGEPPPPQTVFEVIWLWLFSRDQRILRSCRSFGQVVFSLGELVLDWLKACYRSLRGS